MGYIYLITNKLNGMKYVGQTMRDDINERCNQHKACKKSCIGRYLYSAYKHYSIDNFIFQIICICFDSDTNLLEEFYIKKFNTLSPNGYNLTTGGKNCRVSEETRLKMSNALKNRAGHKHNKETIMKISFSLRGKLNPNYGKQMSLEQRTKISKRMKELYSNKTELTEPQLTGLDIGRNKIKRKVGKYDVNCNLIETYNSISEAGRLNNIAHSAISKVCRCLPKQKTAAGFIWKYIE